MIIAERFGCTPHRVRNRRIRLVGNRQPSSTERWTAQEDAIVEEKKAAGYKTKVIVLFLPGRSIDAIDHRWGQYLRLSTSSSMSPYGKHSGCQYTDADVQHIIHLRIEQRLSFTQIGSQLGRSVFSIYRI